MPLLIWAVPLIICSCCIVMPLCGLTCKHSLISQVGPSMAIPWTSLKISLKHFKDQFNFFAISLNHSQNIPYILLKHLWNFHKIYFECSITWCLMHNWTCCPCHSDQIKTTTEESILSSLLSSWSPIVGTPAGRLYFLSYFATLHSLLSTSQLSA